MAIVALLSTSCQGDDYVAPTFPEGVIPTISIEGVTSADTGVFLATDGPSSLQTFNIVIDVEGTIFPDCTAADASVSLSDYTDFTLTYIDGESTFTVAPNSENGTTSTPEAQITAIIDSGFGGNVSTLKIAQGAANIPYFSTQPSNTSFSGTVSVGSVAYTTFVVDPMDVEGITEANFTVTASSYYEAVITPTSGVENGYTITFTATMAAVDGLSSSEDDIVISCSVTMTYNETTTEESEQFTVTMSD